MSGSEEICRICPQPAVHKCSSCKNVGYCSRDHQKQDWKNHKDLCKPYQINSSPDIGNYLEATRVIQKGATIINEHPLIIGPSGDEIVCVGCYDGSPECFCQFCLWPACSATCQGLTDPEHHGAECLILRLYVRRVQHIPPGFFRYETLIPLRCLLLQRRSPKKWKQLLDLESHLKFRGPSTDTYKRVQENIVNYLKEHFLTFLKQIEENSSSKTLLEDASDEIIHKVCGIVDVNCLDVTLPSQTVASAIYNGACLMEHNCIPNTRHHFEINKLEFKITVTASQNINMGDHITTMYTHALWGTQQRQNHLKSNKYFTCRCRRCSDPTELGTYISALKCLAPSTDRKVCGGWQLPVNPLSINTEWKCNNCPTSLTSSQVLDLVTMIGNEVEHVQTNSPTVENLQILLAKLKKLLHPNHFHCYGVMHSLIQLYGRQSGYTGQQINNVTLNKKIEMCKDMLTVTLALDPNSSRLTLYEAVIRQEMHNAIFLLIKRKVFTNSELNEKIEELRIHLERGIEILKFEPEDSPGNKISNLLKQTLGQFQEFVKDSCLVDLTQKTAT